MEILNVKMEIKNENIIGKDLLEYLFPLLFCALFPGIYLDLLTCHKWGRTGSD
jgi:hypothetical protein